MLAAYPPLLISMLKSSGSQSSLEILIEDPGGAVGHAQTPACVTLGLAGRLREAAVEGRLELRRKSEEFDSLAAIPVQCIASGAKDSTIRLFFLLPEDASAQKSFLLQESSRPAKAAVQTFARQNGDYFEITEGAEPVLVYRYAKVEPGALLNSISEANRKYAVARSDYIHPLYGPDGEVLTTDWPVDHPHHRGIYWAWPEVDWRGKRGDLHALQKVFACPAGECKVISGSVFGQIEAINLWRWEEREPIVRERALLRAYRSTPLGRMLDLEFTFHAVADPVQLARRETTHYGGLNLRLNSVRDQSITKHIDPPESKPRRAWSDLSGLFAGAQKPTGLAVIQSTLNPDYPGDWIDYPELNWLQPTFPASNTRYELRKDQPLVLRYRLWLHPGAHLSERMFADLWQATNSKYSSLAAPLIEI